MRSAVIPLLAAVAWTGAATAGPFAPAAGQSGSTAVARTDASLIAWATGVASFQQGTDLTAEFTNSAKALGPAEGNNFDVVSLGNGGRMTLTFAGTVSNGAGYDFAVFENSFSDNFLELAFVEVSSDGVNFVRFPHFSLTPSPVGAFGTLDPTNIQGLAGKYRMGFGTPFDLQELAAVSQLNINRITHIRLVDVVGDGTELDTSPPGFPFFGPHQIFDPFKTINSAGFDLDGIGVRYFTPITPVPEPIPQPVPLHVPLPLTFAVLGSMGCLTLRRRQRRRGTSFTT